MKKAIITGASSGLGKAIGSQLIKKDCNVINLSRNPSEFQDITLDLSNNEQIDSAIKKIRENHSNFDTLVINSGIMPLAKIGESDFDIDNLFKVNVTGSIKLIEGLMKLIKKNNADLVIIGSTASFKSSQDHGIYSATKHALEGFIKSLQIELKDFDVRIIGFHPGGFNSNLRNGEIKKGYMDPSQLAKLVINTLELPRSMEVSQIIINRNKAYS